MYNLCPNTVHIRANMIHSWNKQLSQLEFSTNPQHDAEHKRALILDDTDLYTIRERVHAWIRTYNAAMKNSAFSKHEKNTLSAACQECLKNLPHLYENPIWYWSTDIAIMQTIYAHIQPMHTLSMWIESISRDNIDHYSAIIPYIASLSIDEAYYHCVYQYENCYDDDLLEEQDTHIDGVHDQWQKVAHNRRVYTYVLAHEEARKAMVQAERKLHMNIPRKTEQHVRHTLAKTLALESIEVQQEILGVEYYKKTCEDVIMHGIKTILKTPSILDNRNTARAFLHAYMLHAQHDNLQDRSYTLEQKNDTWSITTTMNFHGGITMPLQYHAQDWETYWMQKVPDEPIYRSLKTLLLHEFPTDSDIAKILRRSPISDDYPLQMLLDMNTPASTGGHLQELLSQQHALQADAAIECVGIF